MHIDTHRLHLRPVMASDVDDLYRIYGDPATNTFNPAGPYPNIDYAEVVLRRWLAHWQTHGFGNWAISMRNTPEHIIGFGGVSLRSYNDVTINNLGYRFSTEAWGKGLATEFAIGAMRYGFEVLKLAEMSAVVRANHLASQKVLEKAGMRYINDIADVKDAPPSLLYSLTLNEWLSQISGVYITFRLTLVTGNDAVALGDLSGKTCWHAHEDTLRHPPPILCWYYGSNRCASRPVHPVQRCAFY
ncbi:ribosomal-protein-alanine N-acetyltransferase [Klebsiella variicola]|nr:ribosomal-protein-alanine N-acetyltransferase [Klebsiella variicola]